VDLESKGRLMRINFSHLALALALVTIGCSHTPKTGAGQGATSIQPIKNMSGSIQAGTYRAPKRVLSVRMPIDEKNCFVQDRFEESSGDFELAFSDLKGNYYAIWLWPTPDSFDTVRTELEGRFGDKLIVHESFGRHDGAVFYTEVLNGASSLADKTGRKADLIVSTGCVVVNGYLLRISVGVPAIARGGQYNLVPYAKLSYRRAQSFLQDITVHRTSSYGR